MNLESQAAAEDRYFGSYSKVGIHQAMIKDRSRTLAYKAAITENRHLFKNKVRVIFVQLFLFLYIE